MKLSDLRAGHVVKFIGGVATVERSGENVGELEHHCGKDELTFKRFISQVEDFGLTAVEAIYSKSTFHMKKATL